MEAQELTKSSKRENKGHGRSRSIRVGKHDFSSKKAAEDYYRTILYRNEISSPLTGDDLADVAALLACHPSSLEKIRNGVAFLYVDNDGFGGRCFHLCRLDGSTDNFSFKLCLSGEPPAFRRFSNACRFVVKPDIAEFREKTFNDPAQSVDGFVKCAKTGAWVSSAGAHIDHAEPLLFSRIVSSFISSRNINLDEFDAYLHEGLYGAVFADAALIEDFRNYHRDVAVLQVVSRESNLRDAWKGRLNLRPKTTAVAS
jgi:Protein of unknown function (DUF3223)